MNFIIIKACIVALIMAELLGLSFYLCYKDLVEKSKEENGLTPYSIISVILLNELTCLVAIILIGGIMVLIFGGDFVILTIREHLLGIFILSLLCAINSHLMSNSRLFKKYFENYFKYFFKRSM
ncbi:hypothetical protein [Ligilactobacillus salivarius]|uniref:hypothetical protein n=1 Tax=Ligilactobacillus salivarius TaxID=1624 RepID=UPI0009DAB2BB|nr:hypothetical protein [Ligilactobacillus salivarius]